MYRALVMSAFRLLYPHQAIVSSLLKCLRILPSEQAPRAGTPRLPEGGLPAPALCSSTLGRRRWLAWPEYLGHCQPGECACSCQRTPTCLPSPGPASLQSQRRSATSCWM